MTPLAPAAPGARDPWFPPFVMALLIVLPLATGLLARATAPAGYVYSGFLNPGDDVNFYYSFIRQARDGHWLFTNHNVASPHPAVLVNLQWLAVGKLAAKDREAALRVLEESES